MIKNIIFDIGNVLVTFDPLMYFSQYFDMNTNAFLSQTVFDSDEWLQVDQGLLSEAQAKTIFLNRFPQYHDELEILFTKWKGLMVLKEDTFQFLKELKDEGYRIYLLSNIGDESYEYCTNHFPFFECIDGCVYSYQEKLVKPNEQLYQCLLERYQLVPKECIFMDDALSNIETAHRLGIHAILFKDCASAKEEVLRILKEEVHVEN